MVTKSSRALRALVFGHSPHLIEAVPALLNRAGFEVSVISTSRLLGRSRHVVRFVHVRDRKALISVANDEARSTYDLVVAGDDGSLSEIMRSDLGVEDKLRLLPICSKRGLEHICSKIGLSRLLARAGVPTPPFDVAETAADLMRATAAVGFPLMVKADFGGGGQQVFSVGSEAELANLPPKIRYPLLVQKRLSGREIDCSGFFRNGEPISFSFSTILKRVGSFGPSSLRAYRFHADSDDRLVGQLGQLGGAIAANGFVNIGAIQSDTDGQLSFFEADMRPTVWVEHPKYFGEDPAVAIGASFAKGGAPDRKRPLVSASEKGGPTQVILPYAPRLPWLEIILNKYDCLSYYENYLRRAVILDKVRAHLRSKWTLRRLTSFLRASWEGWRHRWSRRPQL